VSRHYYFVVRSSPGGIVPEIQESEVKGERGKAKEEGKSRQAGSSIYFPLSSFTFHL
jgi:hypothetical protein